MKNKELIELILKTCDDVDCAKSDDDHDTAVASDARFDFAYDLIDLIRDNMKVKKPKKS